MSLRSPAVSKGASCDRSQAERHQRALWISECALASRGWARAQARARVGWGAPACVLGTTERKGREPAFPEVSRGLGFPMI